MALVKCPECGAQVSDQAAACLKCGLPRTAILAGVKKKAREQRLAFVGIAVVLAVGAVCGVSGTSKTSVSSPAPAPTTVAQVAATSNTSAALKPVAVTNTPIPATAVPTATPVIVDNSELMDRLDSAWDAGNWPTAIQLLTQLQRQAPDALDYTDKLYVAHFNLAKESLEKNDKQAAAAEFVKADALSPERGEAKAELKALTPTPTAVPPTVTPTAAPRPAAAETPQVSGSKALVVSKPRFFNGLGYSTPDRGKEFVVVAVGIKNVGSTTESYNPFDFKMQGHDGDIKGPAFVTGLDDQLHSGQLAPNGTTSGTIAFQINKGDRDLTLIYQACLLFCSDIKVDLSR